MSLFRRQREYNRSKILAEAARARDKGKRKKAIALYRQILALEPENADVHRKIAPLLARTQQPSEAWESYCRAAKALALQGHVEKAIGVYRDATRYLPHQIELWEAIADLQIECHRRADAVETLLEGRRHFHARKHRPEAIRLLLCARRLDRYHFGASFDLARLWAKTGDRTQALRMLEELATWCDQRELRRVRGKQLLLSPTLAAARRWLRALVREG